jgi:hypothetical protein
MKDLFLLLLLSFFLSLLLLSFSLAQNDQLTDEGKEKALYQEKKFAPLPEGLLEKLSEKSEEYKRYALKFVCTEVFRKASYSVAKKEYSREKLEHRDYLLEVNPDRGRFSAYRQKSMKTAQGQGRTVIDFEMNFPEAYSWVFIFSKNFRNTMKYGYFGMEIYFYKLAHVISFRGFQPYSDGRDIRQWEGKIWVEEGTWNILRVEAKPIHQDDILELKRLEYNRAFSFMGIKFKKKPIGYSCMIYFDFEQEGLSFPTEAWNETFEPISEKETAPHSKIILSYADYHFFKTESREEVIKFQED